jgi:hypothetical protein
MYFCGLVYPEVALLSSFSSKVLSNIPSVVTCALVCAGMLTMTNHNPSLTNEQIKQLLENSFGPIHSIVTPYDNPYQRNIEFMDIRHAQKGRQAIGLSAKIPTISEVGAQHPLCLLSHPGRPSHSYMPHWSFMSAYTAERHKHA